MEADVRVSTLQESPQKPITLAKHTTEQIEDRASIISSIKFSFSTTGLREPSISPTNSKFYCDISLILKDREILGLTIRIFQIPIHLKFSEMSGQASTKRKPKLTKPWDIKLGQKLILIGPARALKCQGSKYAEFVRELAEKRLTNINHLQIQAHEATKLVRIGLPVNQRPKTA
ncbi:non-photochemical quenching 1 [Striga asiatica]|uniref:Non-photochemical quenching 1 n=1 Tax=Striga asiatica TaxID=4170 RepID=A0A5A7PRV1_STRAF|nr:non-photochemical quenching 1 [Striga asiatica]